MQSQAGKRKAKQMKTSNERVSLLKDMQRARLKLVNEGVLREAAMPNPRRSSIFATLRSLAPTLRRMTDLQRLAESTDMDADLVPTEKITMARAEELYPQDVSLALCLFYYSLVPR